MDVTSTMRPGGGPLAFEIRNEARTATSWMSIFVMFLSIPVWTASPSLSWALWIFSGSIDTAQMIWFSSIHLSSTMTPFTVNFRYLGETNRHHTPLHIERHFIQDVRHPSFNNLTFWDANFHWRIQWETNSLWGFFPFAEVVHFHVLAPFNRNVNWRVARWW